MSYALIRKQLELALNALSAGFDTAYENAPYTPKVGTAYQRVNLLPGQTENPTMGDGFKREVGIFQIMLAFPPKAGPAAALARAEVLRVGMKRGTTYNDTNVRVLINQAPYISPALQDDVWYMLPVSVPFIADVFG